MAKKLVAKVRFDDGSNVGESGKSSDYAVGQEYKGDAASMDAAVKAGLVCDPADLKVKAVTDVKDQTIAKLEKANAKLQAENQELRAALSEKKPVAVKA